MNQDKGEKTLPLHFWLGLGLAILFWFLNWNLEGLRTHWGFFPLWLGYALTVDGLTFYRKGDSLLCRNPLAYLGLFLVSVPGWWLFELVNLRTQNWYYPARNAFSDLEYVFWASLSFSTVMPAVFGTAEMIGTFRWIQTMGPGPRIVPTTHTLRNFTAAGALMLTLLLLWPRYFFPFVWLSVFCLIEPFNCRRGHRTLMDSTRSGDWRPVWALWTGCLICGFFWEMWNYWSYPKWKYEIPFVDFLHIFEMPLLGYTGYLPFALELFGLYHLAVGLLGLKGWRDYIRLV